MIIHSVNEYADVAKTLADKLTPGAILAISGPLGAGKTTLVQALAKELGADRSPKSPTFMLMRIHSLSHPTLKRLVHVDAYRLEDEKDLIPLDLEEELATPGTIIALEWPEQVEGWLSKQKNVTRVRIQPRDEGREIMIG